MFGNIIKLTRYSNIYGVRRAIVKAIGRLRYNFPIVFILNYKFYVKNKDIAIIGCGQFAFSTIAFFIVRKFGARFKYCVDIDFNKTNSFSIAYDVPNSIVVSSADEIDFQGVRLVYIASNHSSHSLYACNLLKKGIDIYVEKPIAVSRNQLDCLVQTYNEQDAKLYVGYNRPFSSAITELKSFLCSEPFTLTCTVIGHFIPPEHWYRNPDEGTRICGNLGHWLDLAVHLLFLKKKCTYELNISICYSNTNVTDDDIALCIKTDEGDLINIVLTSREEPFEGINETIIFQQKGIFAKIDDFRRAEFQLGDKKIKRKYRPKDVGHKTTVLQPFNQPIRNVEEVFVSTGLMLHIMEMVKSHKTQDTFKLVTHYETSTPIVKNG